MFGLIIAFIAGFVTPHAETPVARPVARALSKFITIEDGEIRLLSFLLMLLAAALVSSVFHTGSTLGLIVGATLGYFALRIVAALKAMLDARKD